MAAGDESLIPVQRPLMPTAERLLPYLEGIDSRRWYANFGTLTTTFESRCAQYFGVPVQQVVSLSSATLALEAAIDSAPVARCAVWHLPSWTFTATAAAAIRSSGSARFVDVDEAWRSVQGDGSRAMIDVLPFGADLALDRLGLTEQETVIVDGAASFDALGGAGGLLEDIPAAVGVVVSFHATKVPSCAEGGIFFTNRPEWAAEARRWSNYGFSGARSSSRTGTNGKLSEYHAAVGLASLDEWPHTKEKWRGQVQRALRISSRLGLAVHPALHDELISPYWIVQLPDSAQRDHLGRVLYQRGVDTRRWWEDGCHQMPAYCHLEAGPLPMTRRLAQTTIGLPLAVDASDEDWDRIEAALELALESP